MTSEQRTRNEKLRSLLKEAGWTNESFARAVNRTGGEAGQLLQYDRTSVSHWLSGSRPRRPVPAFVAETFTRRLGRVVSVADTGFERPEVPLPSLPTEENNGVGTLLQLLTADLNPTRRLMLRQLPYVADLAMIPDWPELSRGLDPSRRPATPVKPNVTEPIQAMTGAFASADRAFGGGHARMSLATYLATDVAALLQGEVIGPVRRSLLEATGGLTYLIGFMCFDNLQHNLAQRYFRAALQLTAEASDTAGYTTILRGMSMQAGFLGHHRQAVHLAEVALRHIDDHVPHETHAAILAQAAVAHAALSGRRVALSYLTEAEKHLIKASEANGKNASLGSAPEADLAHQTGQVLDSLHDYSGAEVALRSSLEHRASPERRSRLITTHKLAELQLRRGQVERACYSWQRFLSEYPRVRSGRIRFAFGTLQEHFRPYQDNPLVRSTLRLAGSLSAEKPPAGSGESRSATDSAAR